MQCMCVLTMLVVLVGFLQLPMPSASAPQSFEVLVTEGGGVPRVQQAVAFSFPLPEGAVSDPAHLRILEGQAEMMADLRALDTWPDGSVQWVRAEVVLGELAVGAKKRLTVEYGAEVQRKAGQRLSVQEAEGRVSVANGVLEVTIGLRGIERLALGEKVLALGDAMRVMDADGQVYDGWAGSPEVSVKRHGAVAVEVDVSGATSPPFNFRSRYTIYRDCPVIRRQTFIESAEDRDVQLVTINALRPASEIREVTVLGRDSMTVAAGDSSVYWHMTVPSPETWTLAEIAPNGQTEIVSTFEAQEVEDPARGIRGERPGYFMDVSAADAGLALAGEVRQWGRDAGLSYTLTDDSPELSINAHGMWPQHQGQIYGQNWRWYEGVAKNFETFIIAHEGQYSERVRDAALATYRPLYAMPDPAYARATGAFGLSEDGLEFDPLLEPVRRWPGLAQMTIAEYEKLVGDKRAERIGGLISGEVYRTTSGGGGGAPNRAVNDTRHWFTEAYRKGDGPLLRDAIEIAYAEMDYGIYHLGDPNKIGRNHYHGNWKSITSADYGCRSFACELAYLATGDEYFLDAWQLELDSLMRTKGWDSRSAGYTMVDMVWAYERFKEPKYLDKANEIFAYALARQRPDGATTQGLKEGSALKPWVMGILMEGVLELHRVDPSDEKLRFLTRIADYLLEHQLPDGSWLYIEDDPEGLREGKPWKQGTGTSTLAPQVIRLYELTGDIRYLMAAQRAIIWLFNTADRDTEVLRVRHAIQNHVRGGPSHTTCSYIFSLCARMSDVCRRAGLPFLVSLPTRLEQELHWGVTALTHLGPKAISFEAALPEERGESEVNVAGFTAAEVMTVEINGAQRDLAADENGILTFAIPASEATQVVIRAKQ